MLLRRFSTMKLAVQLLLRQYPKNTVCSTAGTELAIRHVSASIANKTRKVVYVSSSQNIFHNLALEEWLYENLDMATTDYLLMWKNGPSVVIGRHQNPWLECNVGEAVKRGMSLARRSSGGGTVYHDQGNLNLSFLKHRSRYDRRKNLSLVVAALTSQWDLDLDLNCRDDLVLDGVYKVSGTASKLGGNRTYHHFTLVFHVDKDTLSSILLCPLLGVDSKATRSVPSPVKNLKEDAPDMTFDMLIKVIGQHFMQEDNGKEITTVDPTDESQFPGVGSIQRRLRSWDWVFGMTPAFSITRIFTKSFPQSNTGHSHHSLRIQLFIEKGTVRKLDLNLSGEASGGASVDGLPFRLLDVVDIDGEKLEARRLRAVWERWRQRVREMEGEADYDLLVWGLDCLIQCVPVGFGEETEK
ncbi:lipoyl amidotransferase LIPT1, mitochondrial-like isoform X1 [Littorina saxatilis]|uniref:BPL/LPL catalytic domain-containing protein n=1 Tax=Littorina saxatilis TaxID=31220 RepID=A0AAN9ASU8_9CAEN